MVFYVIMFMLCVFSFIYFLARHRNEEIQLWFILLELFINIILVLEVSLRIIAWRSKFFSKVINIIDVIVVFSCVSSFILFFFDTPEGVIYAFLLAFRYVIQLIRLILFWKKQREINAAKKIIVDFSKLTADDNLDDMDDYY